ncbi:hypothetical protein BK704_25990 [[Bacillus thuringiensis] serovar konkukian]|nr:hypothetical protein BK704_25990 [[Bacillus thuringiensis] serovar konkukian]
MKLYRRFSEYIDCNSKYISDFFNISTVTQIISAIFQIYRLTDKKRQQKGDCSPLFYASIPVFRSIFSTI